MKRLIYSLVFIVALLQGCSDSDEIYTSSEKIAPILPPPTSSQQATWNLIVGTWFGSQPTEEGGRSDWISWFYDNGTYQMAFRIYKSDGELIEQTEFGVWGLDDSFMFTIVKGGKKEGTLVKVKTLGPYYSDIYKILSLDENKIVYESITPALKFTVRRVADDFEFPGKT